MLAVLEKALETISKEDITALIGWPEGETVEFNETLPGEKGRPDPWLSGEKVSRFAKDELFKEIVALTNSSGGHFFLGIEESTEQPPCALAIKPLPRCIDLAERLKRAAYSLIDPPIPGLNAVGIPTEDDGSGVVVFRVPQSHVAQHRSSDRHCYIRRGSESAPMSMRQIQDLTIHLSRRIDELRTKFERAHLNFSSWFRRVGDGSIGFRATAVPVGTRLYIERVHPVADRILRLRKFQATLGGMRIALVPFHRDDPVSQPVFRGARKVLQDTRGTTHFNASCDGVIEIKSRRDWTNRSGELENGFYLVWIFDYVANLAESARVFASIAKVPECEYGITFEICCTNGAADIPLRIMHPAGGEIGTMESPVLVEEPLSLGDRDALMSRVMCDIYNACHARLPEPPELLTQNWD
jgi:hypothetical protein